MRFSNPKLKVPCIPFADDFKNVETGLSKTKFEKTF